MLLQIHEPGQTPAPHDQDRGLAVGIDLGTTNSVVALAIADRAEVIRDEEGDGLLPSVVAYGADGSVLVGEKAREQLLDHPEGVVSSIKRLMGRSAADLKQLGGALPYDLDETTGIGMVRLKIRGRRLTPVEISADIL
ncbi:MAG: Hsp70 family protein, partial [Hypericibacter sp.]